MPPRDPDTDLYPESAPDLFGLGGRHLVRSRFRRFGIRSGVCRRGVRSGSRCPAGRLSGLQLGQQGLATSFGLLPGIGLLALLLAPPFHDGPSLLPASSLTSRALDPPREGL